MQLLQRVKEYLRMDKHIQLAVKIKGSSLTKTTNAWQKLLLVYY